MIVNRLLRFALGPSFSIKSEPNAERLAHEERYAAAYYNTAVFSIQNSIEKVGYESEATLYITLGCQLLIPIIAWPLHVVRMRSIIFPDPLKPGESFIGYTLRRVYRMPWAERYAGVLPIAVDEVCLSAGRLIMSWFFPHSKSYMFFPVVVPSLIQSYYLQLLGLAKFSWQKLVPSDIHLSPSPTLLPLCIGERILKTLCERLLSHFLFSPKVKARLAIYSWFIIDNLADRMTDILLLPLTVAFMRDLSVRAGITPAYSVDWSMVIKSYCLEWLIIWGSQQIHYYLVEQFATRTITKKEKLPLENE